MDEKIAEKILEEIRSLKIGQQRIVGEVEVLNSMCKKLDMGQKSLEVMRTKNSERC